jgi:hypothetical protein
MEGGTEGRGGGADSDDDSQAQPHRSAAIAQQCRSTSAAVSPCGTLEPPLYRSPWESMRCTLVSKEHVHCPTHAPTLTPAHAHTHTHTKALPNLLLVVGRPRRPALGGPFCCGEVEEGRVASTEHVVKQQLVFFLGQSGVPATFSGSSRRSRRRR